MRENRLVFNYVYLSNWYTQTPLLTKQFAIE